MSTLAMPSSGVGFLPHIGRRTASASGVQAASMAGLRPHWQRASIGLMTVLEVIIVAVTMASLSLLSPGTPQAEETLQAQQTQNLAFWYQARGVLPGSR